MKIAREIIASLIEKEAGLINDYKTEKSIKKNEKDSADRRNSYLKHVLAPAVGASALSTGASKLSKLPMKKVLNANSDNKMTAEEATAHIKRFADIGKVKINEIAHDGLAGGKAAGPHYIPGVNKINSGAHMMNIHKKYGDFVMAHEVGHAVDYQHRGGAAHARDIAGGLAPAVAGAAVGAVNRQHIRDKIRRLDKDKKDGKFNKAMDFVEKHPYVTGAGLGAAAGMATLLPREIAADVNAYKMMKQTMSKGEAAKKALSGSARQLANYALVTGATGAATGATTAGMTRYNEKKQELKDKHDQSKLKIKKTAGLKDTWNKAYNQAGEYVRANDLNTIARNSGLTKGNAAQVGAITGGTIGTSIGNYVAEKRSQKLRRNEFGAPPRRKDFRRESDFEAANKQYRDHASATPVKGDDLKHYAGITGAGTALGAGAGAALGAGAIKAIEHLSKKQASDILDEMVKEAEDYTAKLVKADKRKGQTRAPRFGPGGIDQDQFNRHFNYRTRITPTTVKRYNEVMKNNPGHIINKTAGKITEKDDLTKEDVHDRYKGYDTSEAVGNRKLKYQLGGAALGATVTPAVLGGLAYLAKHKLNRDVDPRAFAQSGFTTGVGTGFMLGGMAAKAKQADRDRKVLEDRYKNDPKTLAMAQDHGIAMAEALRDLKKKAEELEVLLEKQAETIKMEPKAGDALSNKPSKQIVAELVKKETESPSGQYA